MNTSLSERYIAATITELPAELHDDVRAELEASIADAIVARTTHGESRETAERAVLTELGDPGVLAASYADRPLHLIGPRYYLAWWRLLKTLLIIIPPIVFVVAAFAQVLANATVGTVIAQAIVVTMTTAVHLCFWTTLAFVVLERTGTDLGTAWTVDDLPQAQERRRGGMDLVASLVFLALAIGAVFWDQTRGFVRVEGDWLSVLNPGLWPWAMTALLVLLLLEAVFAIVLYARGGWNIAMAVINTLLNVAFFTWFLTLLVQGELLSPAVLGVLTGSNITTDALYTLAVILSFGVAIVCLWDVADGWIKTYRCLAGGRQPRPAAE